MLGRLGPPSQTVEIGDRTLLYYLLEHSETSTLFLVAHNPADTRVVYDRSVFLFDAGGVLTQMSFSDEIAAAHEGDDSWRCPRGSAGKYEPFRLARRSEHGL